MNQAQYQKQFNEINRKIIQAQQSIDELVFTIKAIAESHEVDTTVNPMAVHTGGYPISSMSKHYL